MQKNQTVNVTDSDPELHQLPQMEQGTFTFQRKRVNTCDQPGLEASGDHLQPSESNEPHIQVD